MLLFDTQYPNSLIQKTFTLERSDITTLGDILYVNEPVHHINEYLGFITANADNADTAELIMSVQFEQWLAKNSKQYDIVLILGHDAPHNVTASVAGKLCATNVLAIESQKTKVKCIEEAKEALALAGVKVSGCVFIAGNTHS